MDSAKYIGLDVHKESISIAVLNDAGKIVMECVIETNATLILQFFRGLRGELHVTFIERNIKGRPFWSRVLSVRLEPFQKGTPCL